MDFFPNTTDIKRLKEVQEEVRRRVILKDDHGRIRRIGGVDQAFTQRDIISVVSVYEYEGLRHEYDRVTVSPITFPYIPGFLSFREGPAILKTMEGVEVDLLLVNGHGIAHPRGAGLATHVGVALNIPTVGVAQRLLVGEVRGEEVWFNGRQVGWVMRLNQRFGPIYVSPGHRVSIEGAREIVERCKGGHKLPEPLFRADKVSKEVRRQKSF